MENVDEDQPQETRHRLSPISSEDSDPSPVEYDKGVYGTTPPSGGRFRKIERRGHKHKSSKKSSPGHVTYRNLERQAHAISRVKSAEWPNVMSEEIPEDVKSPRRHTVYDTVPEYPVTGLMDTNIKGKKKLKHNKDKHKNRKEKLSFIPPHMREIKPSFSFTENINTSESLSAAYLQSPSAENGGLLSNFPRIERSHSDAQLSLTLSTSQSMHCPPDRKQFYRSFTKALNIVSRRQHQTIPAYHIPRQHSENLSAENPFGHINDELWVELRASLNGYTVEEQEEHDSQLHNEVDSILDRIIEFRFTPPTQSIDDCFRGIDDYEPILSLPSGGIQLKSINEHNFDEEDEGPQTLTQQTSSESDGSSVQIENFSKERFLTNEQQSALHKVDSLLQDLEKVESLYSSTAKIGRENTKYCQMTFKRRKDALVLWHKITDGIANTLARLSKWFGTPVHSVHNEPTPSSSIEPSRSSSSGGFGMHTISEVNPEESLPLSAVASSLLTQSSVYSSVNSRTTLQRLFSSRNDFSTDDDKQKGYRRFVNQVLKKKGLPWLIDELLNFISPILGFAEDAMIVKTHNECDSSSEDESRDNERLPLLFYLPSDYTKVTNRITSSAPRCWVDEFSAMNLPSFSELVTLYYLYASFNLLDCTVSSAD